MGGSTAFYPRVILSHCDHVSEPQDISLQLRNAETRRGSADFARSGHLLLAISPHSQYAKANLIEHDWEHAKSHLAEWEKEASGSPTLLGAIARRYQAMGKTDDAEHCSQVHQVAHSTTGPTRCWPESTQKRQHRHWLAVLEQFLEEGGDPGLDQATRFGSRSPTTTWPRNSGTRPGPIRRRRGDGSGLGDDLRAQNCAEGRKDWDQAEQWARATSERYPSTAWDRWYTLCAKTGTGDVEAALAFTNQWVDENAGGATPVTRSRFATFYLSSGQFKKALPILRQVLRGVALNRRLRRSPGSSPIWSTTKPPATSISNSWKPGTRASLRIQRPSGGSFMRPSIATASLDLKAIAKEQEGSTPIKLCLPHFIIGMFLEKHGKPVEAREFLKKAADSPFLEGWTVPVARDTIRRLDKSTKHRKPSLCTVGATNRYSCM